ncbi:MAG: hypothetical protein E6I32_01410 [Chloroflexi bacterium]|nr:MAG: hypothetical protein E6I32_01410 [Chloroflexota bacterium]
MTTQDIIIQMFCLVDDQMGNMPKHTQAKLYPSEVVTIGILFALKGGHFRAFPAGSSAMTMTCLQACPIARDCNGN